MATLLSNYQRPGDLHLRRTKHVWRKHPSRRGALKCVLCGGISYQPSDDCDCREHEPLTDEDRDMCPKEK
jgi:hypothetical protein